MIEYIYHHYQREQKLILINTFKAQTGHKSSERNRIIQQIDGLETRLKKARDKYADDEMLADDYKSALQIDHLYHEGSIEEKRNVIGSIRLTLITGMDWSYKKIPPGRWNLIMCGRGFYSGQFF